MYKVIKAFTDLQDNNRAYNVGDTFPHVDCAHVVTEQRFTELASCNNKQGKPLIEAVEEKKAPVKKGKKTAAE